MIARSLWTLKQLINDLLKLRYRHYPDYDPSRHHEVIGGPHPEHKCRRRLDPQALPKQDVPMDDGRVSRQTAPKSRHVNANALRHLVQMLAIQTSLIPEQRVVQFPESPLLIRTRPCVRRLQCPWMDRG
jgi:hypothetical protein